MKKRADYNGLDGGRLKRRRLEKSKNYAMIENPVTEMPEAESVVSYENKIKRE